MKYYPGQIELRIGKLNICLTRLAGLHFVHLDWRGRCLFG